MLSEDICGQMLSPYERSGMGRQPLMSWREFGRDREEKCGELVDKIDRCRDVLDEAIQTSQQALHRASANPNIIMANCLHNATVDMKNAREELLGEDESSNGEDEL